MTHHSAYARRAAVLVAAALALGSCHNNPVAPNPGPTPAFVVFSKPTLLMTPRDTIQLAVSVLDKDNALIAGATVTFASSDTTLIRVSGAGSAVALAKVGTGVITASSGGVHGMLPFQVAGTPTQVLLRPGDTTITEGRSFQYRFKIVDSLGDSIRYLPLAFTSDDPLAVQVTSGGLVTGTSGGPETVTASHLALSGVATVTVQDTNVVKRLPLGNAPYGVGAAKGLVYVAPIIGTSVFRIGLPAGSLADSIPVGNGNPAELALDSAGDTVFVTKRAANILGILSVAADSQVDSLPVPGEPYAVLLGSGRTAFIGTASAGQVYKADLSTRKLTDSLAIATSAIHMAMGAGDSLIYVALTGLNSVEEVRASTMAVKRTFSAVASTIQDVATSPDGAELYVADETGSALHVITISSGGTTSVQTRGGTFGVTMSPDGQTIVVGTVAGFVYFLDRSTHAVKHRVWIGGTPRLLRVDATTGLTVVANEGSSEVDIVR